MSLRSLFFYIVLLLNMVHFGQAQSIELKIPLEQQANLGEEFTLPLAIHDVHPYSIQMEGQPPSATLEGHTFRWTPKKQEQLRYLIHFKLLDSNQVLIDETLLSLIVNPSSNSPYLVFDQNVADTIQLVENKTFSFTATLKSRQDTDPRALMTYFQFNENTNLRNFDSCSVRVNGDQLFFRWTPSNREALQEHLKFRITVIDTDQSICNQVLNFKIKNINQAPVFLYSMPDSLYFSPTLGLIIDCAAKDPDNDKLKYDYAPKHAGYSWIGTQLVIKPDNGESSNVAVPLTILVSDNNQTIKRNITLIKNNDNNANENNYFQPVVGDFTKKVFSEGDSVLTYLNISNNIDLKQVDITYSDLNLPPGIKSLTQQLVFEKKGSYIKVYSKGILPYSLVNQDYNYNISVVINSKNSKRKPYQHVFVMTIEDRPDPQSLTQQKDSLIQLVKLDLTKEQVYQSTLTKVRNRIHKPWWKKVAIVTGTLSGVLTLIQIENPNKTVSLFSASISLLSIMVTNIPNLSEKALSVVDEKIANSKSRTERMQEKQDEFLYNWSLYMDQNEFDKIRTDLEELLNKNKVKRNEDICAILRNKKVKRKIDNLIKHPSGLDKQTINLEEIFHCR